MTASWLEAYAVAYATAKSTVVRLEKEILWRSTPKIVESGSRSHFKTKMMKLWTDEHGIDQIWYIFYYLQALSLETVAKNVIYDASNFPLCTIKRVSVREVQSKG